MEYTVSAVLATSKLREVLSTMLAPMMYLAGIDAGAKWREEVRIT